MNKNRSAPQCQIENSRAQGKKVYTSYLPKHLFDVMREGDNFQLARLIQAGVKIDRTDQQGNIPLHLAALNGRFNCVNALIKAKPNTIYSVDQQGTTPLHLSALNGHLTA